MSRSQGRIKFSSDVDPINSQDMANYQSNISRGPIDISLQKRGTNSILITQHPHIIQTMTNHNLYNHPVKDDV